MSVPVILAIDVEPDERVVRKTREGWPGFPMLVELLMDRRARLQDATGRPVFFNWYLRLDPQIEIAFGDAGWVFDRYGELIDRVCSAGDSLGLHVHTWRPVRRFFRNTWLADFEDAEWIRHCLTLGLETFRKRTGAFPATMSFGDNFMHESALQVMNECGIRADFSMNPGMKPRKALGKGELSAGMLPDYQSTPRHPFKPSSADFRVPGKTNNAFWEVPVTSGIVGKDKDGSDRWVKLLWGTNPDWVGGITRQALSRPSPYLFAECRTDVLTHPKTRERFLWALDHYESLAREGDLEFMRLESFCDRLEQEAMVVSA
ncbi:hypothetical protein OEW28_17670 [Defluviimonas sp. WL0002]|uniref:Polysaccharide deacetylase n=1 Tax=Albidovulum marisflavi TaxID=2984159 RepID=A0ABT2ZH32_9RHOB|nr:hypothetical protein [Defluviimonas sp. WL0002]MCV2870444.1 hypothetical protein [Defluviimonas sp. WL0002]